MSRTTPRTWIYNELITAAIMNLDIRDMLNAYWPFTTIGDIAYASAADTLTRLGIGSAGQLQKVNAGATAPEWFRFLDREGGSATDWSVKGTTDYIPAAFKFEAGETEIVAANDSGSVTITFPVAFSDKPLVLVGPFRQTAGGARGQVMFRKSNIAAASVDIDVYSDDALGTTYTIKFSWLAIGPP